MHAHYIFLVLCMSTVYHSQNLIFGKKMKDLRWTAHISQVPCVASILVYIWKRNKKSECKWCEWNCRSDV